ncbi:MAG: ABC transporter ATP-binding protein [Planctomycetia bacterium]|nr:ABC transporter ATP-binding protein [Planctomycetia bacterium]
MTNNTNAPSPLAIDLQHVTKTYGSDKTAISDVSYQVKPGTVFALLGENGAGKTTTIRILLGLTRADSGSASVLGLSPVKDDVAIRRRTGYVPEQPDLYEWMTVEEMGRFAAAFYAKGYWPEYCRLVDSFALPMKSKISNLSKGMKAEVSLSLALAHDPELLILDEPTSGLDAMIRRRFMASRVDRASVGQTVFLSSHQITEVERVADTIAIMRKSNVILVEPLEQLKATSLLLTLTYDEAQQPVLTNQVLFGEIIECQVEGRTARLLGRYPVENLIEIASAIPGVIHVETKSPGLEDIFLAYMSR